MSTIQDRMVDKTREMLGEIEGHYDDYFTSWKEVKMYKALNGLGVKGNHAKLIVSHANRNIDELNEAIEGKDKQLEEGYSNFTKTQLQTHCPYYFRQTSSTGNYCWAADLVAMVFMF